MTTDTYTTLAGPVEGIFRDRGSKFIAYAYPVFDEEEIQECLTKVQQLHFKARHHCYGWRLGVDGTQFRANDDGEPSGTAGRPILGQIDSFGLTNVLIVVVRYFGGTLLGTSGLINAYRGAAADALEGAATIDKTIEAIYRLDFDYSIMSSVMNAVKGMELEMVRQEFAETAWLEVALRIGEKETLLHQLKAHIAGKRLTELDPEDKVEGLKVTYDRTRG
jgi:uncharacterized YigZ family protein